MEGAVLGAFRVLSKLGSGGMGKVYLAEVTENVAGLKSGARVALKLIHPHLLEAHGFFKRFVREAELGRAVSHPNVVQTHYADALVVGSAQHHFLVMEYVEGQTLRDLQQELELVPEELCLHIGREVSKGLAAMHGAGIVHRDLKPENVLITPDHDVKIMDLGVARLADEAIRLSQTGAFVGSLRYAAPEQFRGAGKDVDGRADLHALGLILYELSSGVHPYVADEFPQILKRVLEEEPRRLSGLTPQVSPFFEEVVHVLLKKDRERRFASAADLLEVLERGEEATWWTQRARRIRTETRRPLRRIRIPRESSVHGRGAEIAKLRDLYEKAKAGNGQVVLVEGEAGIGKTRLLDELIGQLTRDGEDLDFLFGSYPPGGAATAAGAWSTAYREHFGAEGLEETLERYLSITPILIPAFAALLRGEPPPTGNQILTKDSVHTVFVHVSRALAARRTTIVLIEDLHFAPEEGRALFVALSLALPIHRILLVGTTRPGLPEEWRADLDRLDYASRLELQRLGPKDLVNLLVDVFQSERLAQELGVRIAAKSDGNPFFVFEIIRGLREGNYVRRQPDGRWVTTKVIREIQIPSTVLELVQARISDLGDDEQELLDVAACCGFEFDPRIVAEAIDVRTVPVLRALGRLERTHRLVRSAGPRFVFDHHQVQEALYSRISPLLRQEYHTALAEALLARWPEPEGATAVEICEHLLSGTRGLRAGAVLDPALDHLERGYLNDQAIGLADRALAVPGMLEGRERVEVLLRRDARLDISGRREAQREGLESALDLADSTADDVLRARVRRSFGWFLLRTGDLPAARVHLDGALALSRSSGDRELEGQVAGNLGVLLRRVGSIDDARARFEDSLALARKTGDRGTEGAAMGNLGLVCWNLGRHEEAKAYFERSLAVAEETGNRHAMAVNTGNLGLVSRSQGRYEEARVQFERDLALSQEVGDRLGEAITTGNLGNVFESLGRYEDARSHQERALELSRETGDRHGEIRALGNLAAVCWSLGDVEEARAGFELSLRLAEETGDRGGEAFAFGELGVVTRTLGRFEEARDHSERSLAISRELGHRHQEAYALGLLAALAEDEGRADDARRLHEECLALRRDIGEKSGIATTLVALSRLDLDRGEVPAAERRLDEALELARETKRPGAILAASVMRARLPDGDPAYALAALAQHESRARAVERMEARFRLWELTGEEEHLVEARLILLGLQDHATEEHRAAMLTEVPLHREILAAWARR